MQLSKSETHLGKILPEATPLTLQRRSEVSDFKFSARDAAHRAPTISRPLLGWFRWYARRYLRQHFNALRVTGSVPAERLSGPIVVYSNHASWWDPLVALFLSHQLLPGKSIFAPMDARALKRYGFFRRLGMFGVEAGTSRGAVQFIRQARAILRTPEHVLWLTPQARFADARERPVHFKAGIGHLPGLAEEVYFLPVAIEYTYWEERLPEILVRIGEPYRATRADRSVKADWWVEFFADRLRETQDVLAKQAQGRDSADFRCLLRGRSGVGGVYDWWRQFRARLKGEHFQLEHGQL